jgi:CPA1 family monovalent cation:H+ antiporter
LPLLLRWLNVRDDGADSREERVALAQTSRVALERLNELARSEHIPPRLLELLRTRFSNRWNEFSRADESSRINSALYRKLVRDTIEAQRRSLIDLRNKGKVDNTVLRRIQRLLDLELEEVDLLESTGRLDVIGDET